MDSSVTDLLSLSRRSDAEIRPHRWALKIPHPRGLLISLLGVTLITTPVAAKSPTTLDLTPYRGKVVYLDFWASWCGPCKLSFPYMARMTSFYGRRPFVVIAVNLDHSRERADAFLSESGVDIPVVFDPKGDIARQFHVSAMPTSVLIGRDGRVRYVHQGFFPDQTSLYEAHISELLNEK